jgi:hypothetical protein
MAAKGFALDESGITGTYNGNPTWQATEQGKLDALQEAGLTGYYGGNRTLAGQQIDWGKTMDTANLTGNYNGQRTLQGQEYDFNKGVTEADITGYYNGAPTLDMRKFTLEEAQTKVQNSIAAGQLTVQQGQLALSQAQLAAEQDPNSLDNLYKKAQIDSVAAGTDYTKAQTKALGTKGTTTDYSQYQDQINRIMQYAGDPDTADSQVKAYIENLYNNGILSDEETKQLLVLNGFSVN